MSIHSYLKSFLSNGSFGKICGATLVLLLFLPGGCGPSPSAGDGDGDAGILDGDIDSDGRIRDGETELQDGDTTSPDGFQPDGHTNPCADHPGETICVGNTSYTCGDDGEVVSQENCPAGLCLDGVGCVVCKDGDTYCDGDNLMICAEDNMGYEVGEFCDPDLGLVCDGSAGECISLCEQAAESGSNIGCEYVAVDMVNWPDPYGDEHCFVVLVSNIQPQGNAIVTVEDENGVLLDFPGFGTERTVAPGEMAVLALTGLPGKCSYIPARPNAQSINSGLFPGTAFYVNSTIPVVAYQVNPYEAALSHSTDASLLIPIPALGDQYYVFSYHSTGLHSPATVSIVAVEDNTEVTFEPTVGMQAGGPVPASGTFTTTLNAFEHLQILSTHPGDLTSSLLTATAPVAVFSGGLCPVIPPGSSCCDHIEQQMPPIQSWGWTYLAATPAQRGSEKALWRIMAAVDNTPVTFQPPSMSGYDTTLNAGEYIEIDTAESFLVSSAADPENPDTENEPPILVNQYIKSAYAAASESGMSFGAMGNLAGDPAMALSVPVEQYLDDYIFLADPTYGYNFVVVVRTDPTEPIHLDCLDPIPDDRFTQIVGDYSRAVITLSSETGNEDGTCTSGVRRIWSDSPFGIWVYGYYQCTSYAYPGGMNLQQINRVVVTN